MLCEKPRLFPNVSGLLPCGVCRACRINNRRDKKTRLQLEAQNHDQNLWITLTYSDANLPMEKLRADGRSFGTSALPTLWRPDYQNFLKRLRNYGVPESFKYFFVGEYGDRFNRPHYHACLFGIGHDYQDRVQRAWCRETDKGVYDLIGHIYFGDLTPDSMQYTAGYTVKKMTGFNHDDLHGRYPEFGTSSKGLSLSAVDEVIEAMQLLRFNDVPDYLVVSEQKVPVPRYIKNKVRERLGIIFEETYTTASGDIWKRKVNASESRSQWEGNLQALRHRQEDHSSIISITDLYVEEKRQSLLNQSAKLKMFFEKEKLL